MQNMIMCSFNVYIIGDWPMRWTHCGSAICYFESCRAWLLYFTSTQVHLIYYKYVENKILVLVPQQQKEIVKKKISRNRFQEKFIRDPFVSKYFFIIFFSFYEDQHYILSDF